MLIAHLTDTHVMLPSESRRLLGDTSEALARAVRYLEALSPRADAVLVTGDLTHHGRPGEYERLRDLLAPLSSPVFLVPGNHDRRAPLQATFGDLGYLPAHDGPLHYAIDRFVPRLIGFDSLRRGFAGGAATAEDLAWLGATLEAAPRTPTVLFMHHPPFHTGIVYMDAHGFVGLAELQALIAQHPQLRLILSGHLHRDVVSTSGGTVARTSRSTARQLVPELFERRPLWIRIEKPGLALHAWDEESDSFVSRVVDIPA